MATKQDRFPKKFFNAAMLKDNPLVLTIEEEALEPITDRQSGKTENKSVVTFVDCDTRLICNGTNFDLICEVIGEDDSANWSGHEIELYVDRTSMGANRVDCVRVRAVGSGKPAPAPKKKTKSAAATPVAESSDMDDEIPFA